MINIGYAVGKEEKQSNVDTLSKNNSEFVKVSGIQFSEIQEEEDEDSEEDEEEDIMNEDISEDYDDEDDSLE